LLIEEMYTTFRLKTNSNYALVNASHFTMSYYGVKDEWSEPMNRFNWLLNLFTDT
jgi:hypothetical protein